MSIDNLTHWMCDDCIIIFPYNNITDEYIFQNAITNTNSVLHQMENDYFLFKPFNKYTNEKDTISINNADPDINFYDETQSSPSKYYTNDEFNGFIKPDLHTNSFSMIHYNIRSAMKNGNSFSHYLQVTPNLM